MKGNITREKKTRSVRRGILGLVVMSLLAALFFSLNPFIYWKLQEQNFFELQASAGISMPGKLILHNPILSKQRIRVEGEEAEIRYEILPFLTSQSQVFEIQASGLVLSFKDFRGDALSIPFSELNASLKSSESDSIEIDQFQLEGPEGKVYASGSIQGKTLDLKLSCFVSDEFLKRLPVFVARNIFDSDQETLHPVEVLIRGNLEYPDIRVISDLIQFEMKGKDL